MNWDQWLIVIPARLKSSRLPSKPLSDLAGKPLVVRVYERLDPLKKKGANILVATDSEDVIRVCSTHGVPAQMTKLDHPSGTDRVNEIANRHAFDYVLNVQGDEPFVSTTDLERLAKTLEAQPAPCMGTLIYKNQCQDEFHNPNVVKVIRTSDHKAIYFSRAAIPHSRDASFSYFWQHQGIYAFHKKILAKFCSLQQSTLESTECLEQLRAIENNIDIIVVEAQNRSVGIDTPKDLEEACEIFTKHCEPL